MSQLLTGMVSADLVLPNRNAGATPMQDRLNDQFKHQSGDSAVEFVVTNHCHPIAILRAGDQVVRITAEGANPYSWIAGSLGEMIYLSPWSKFKNHGTELAMDLPTRGGTFAAFPSCGAATGPDEADKVPGGVHGFFRMCSSGVKDASVDEHSATVVFELKHSDIPTTLPGIADWVADKDFTITATVTLTDDGSLFQGMEIDNRGAAFDSFPLFHNYISVADLGSVQFKGFPTDGVLAIDLIDRAANSDPLHKAAPAVPIWKAKAQNHVLERGGFSMKRAMERERCYLDVLKDSHEMLLVDTVLGRQITLTTVGLNDLQIWTPGIGKTLAALKDVPIGDFNRFVGFEPRQSGRKANGAGNVTLAESGEIASGSKLEYSQLLKVASI